MTAPRTPLAPISVTTETTRTTRLTQEIKASVVGEAVRVSIRPPESDPFPLSGASILLSPDQACALAAQLTEAASQVA